MSETLEPAGAEKVLSQAEIDSLLGNSSTPGLGEEEQTGMQRVISAGLISY